MKELLTFFKEIFMMSDRSTKIGLSQFKVQPVEPVKKAEKPQPKDIKLSDLMRRSA